MSKLIKDIVKEMDNNALSALRSVESKDFQQGDKVIVYKSSTYGRLTMKVDKIKRITPTGQVSLENSTDRFKNGSQMGEHSWTSYGYLYPFNQEAIDLYNEATLLLKSEAIVLQNVQLFTTDELKELAERLVSRGAKR